MNALVSLYFLKKTHLISASEDSHIKVWDSSFHSIEKKINSGSATALAYEPVSKYVAASSEDNRINFYSVTNLKDYIKIAQKEKVNSICFMENEDLLATGFNDFTIKIRRQNE